jgi:hypothetical protein
MELTAGHIPRVSRRRLTPPPLRAPERSARSERARDPLRFSTADAKGFASEPGAVYPG